MAKIPFSKKALSIDDQITKLKSRGMLFDDENLAKSTLANINYYRLSGYWMSFEISRDPHKFQPDTKFEEIVKIYNFDKDLRKYLFDGLSNFEVSFRTRWAYEMGTKYGPFSYTDKQYCYDEDLWQDNMDKLEEEIGRSHEVFLKHFSNKYSDQYPPVWMVCEVMSFGGLSCWYNNLRKSDSVNVAYPGIAKNDIATFYNTDTSRMQSWCHSLSIFRNICAHHARIVNKKIDIKPSRPDIRSKPISDLWKTGTTGIYNIVLIILYLNEQIGDSNNWIDDFKLFLRANEDYCEKYLDFPSDWKDEPYWN